MDNNSNIYQMTVPAPLVWPHLITPQAEHTRGKTVFKSVYKGTFLLSQDHPDWQPIREKMRSLAPAGADKFPVEDGTKMAEEARAKHRDREWARGKILFTAQSNVNKFFYSGVLAIGTFMFSAYEGFGGGVTAYLNEVLSLNSGDKIAGGPDAEEKYGDASRFDQYTGHVSNLDPTAGIGSLV